MKQYFMIVYGGMTIIAIGMGISYGGAMVWNGIRASRIDLHISKALSSTVSNARASVISVFSDVILSSSDNKDPLGTVDADGTSVTGLKRIIRYTADQEEDFIDAATRSLPKNSIAAVTAKGYLVRDLTKDRDVISHDADTLMPIASLTKLVTAAVARKLISSNEKIKITRSIINTEGNTGQFKLGEAIIAADLYYPLLMVSSNDAAEAYAQHYGRTKFLAAMNDFAQSIGAYRTYFNDASGLSPANVSTANDMAVILDWIQKNDPEIIRITMLRSKTIGAHTWYNPTHFLSWSYYSGGKNGYTPEANRTGVALFSLGQKEKDLYAIIVLGSEQRDADVVQLLKVVKE